MPKQPIDLQRKLEHLFLAEKFYQTTNPTFEELKLLPPALPETTIDQVQLTTTFCNQTLPTPLYINAMTGGCAQVTAINQKLARVAAALHLPLAVGSMSNYLKYAGIAGVSESYEIVRQTNPHGFILANVSAHVSATDAQKCVDLIQAQSLQIHVNAAQEMVMAEGNRGFVWQENIRKIVQQVSVPVVVKEVGCGMTQKDVWHLEQLGVQNIDLAGRGGTNFVQIENERNHQQDYSFLQNWGLTTLESLVNVVPKQHSAAIWASGGIRSPLDAVKCLVLGASAVGLAAPVLHQLNHHSVEHTIQYFHTWLQQLRELVALLGCQSIQDLTQVSYRLSPHLAQYQTQN